MKNLLSLLTFLLLSAFTNANSVDGNLFYDDDFDGCRGSMEESAKGIKVSLFVCDASSTNDLLIAERFTDSEGYYSFDSALIDNSKSYYIQVELRINRATIQSNCSLETDSDIDENGNSACFTLNDNETTTIDAGVIAQMIVGGHVFIDNNNDGIQNLGENYLGQVGKLVNVDLRNRDSILVQTTVTDAKGFYEFSTDPGQYYVQFLPPASFPVSSTLSSSSDNDVDGNDDGFQNDTDLDGMTDGPISSPLITLTRGQEPTFEPEPYIDWRWILIDANDNLTIDFGLVPMMAISGTVFLDDNVDGYFSPGESNIGERGTVVTIDLYDTDTDLYLRTTTTDANGNYNFGRLLPGNYYMQFTPPYSARMATPIMVDLDNNVDGDSNAIQLDTDGDMLTDGLILSPSITLLGNDEPAFCYFNNDQNSDCTIDFGLLRCMGLEGTTYEDLDKNGCKDSDESAEILDLEWTVYECDSALGVPAAFGLGKVLYSEEGSSLRSADFTGCLTTDKSYYIEVKNNVPGTTLPPFTSKDACNDWSDSDVNMLGQSDCFNFNDGFNIENIDVGIQVEPSSVTDLESLPISLYPNPAQGHLDIKSESSMFSISILNISGQVVLSEKVAGLKYEQRVCLDQLRRGTYILEVLMKNRVEYQKFVKN